MSAYAYGMPPWEVAALVRSTRKSVVGESLRHLPLAGQSLTRGDLRGMDYSSGSLCEVAALCANFTGAQLYKVDFLGAQVGGASFAYTHLRHASLIRAQCKRTSFRGADMRNVCMSDAQCLGADFRGTDLRSANLWRTNMTGARLMGARLMGASLCAANFTDTLLTTVCLPHRNPVYAGFVDSAGGLAEEGELRIWSFWAEGVLLDEIHNTAFGAAIEREVKMLKEMFR